MEHGACVLTVAALLCRPEDEGSTHAPDVLRLDVGLDEAGVQVLAHVHLKHHALPISALLHAEIPLPLVALHEPASFCFALGWHRDVARNTQANLSQPRVRVSVSVCVLYRSQLSHSPYLDPSFISGKSV